MFGKTKFKIRKLVESDAKDAAILYAYVARYDAYFKRVFGKDSVEIEVLRRFSPDVMNVIKFGDSYGAFIKDKLVGIIFSFNIMDWRNNHIAEYNHVFDNDDNFINSVLDFLHMQNTDISYVFAVGVDEQYRCKGIATSLIKTLCSEVGKRYTIISDATHQLAMPMWLSNGFTEELHNGVKLVIK